LTQKTEQLEDLRVRRTRKMLQGALIELAVEKQGFSDITIQDITERAMVNRSTFYRHYLDKCDLVTQYMNDVYALLPEADAANNQSGKMDEGSPNGLLALLQHIQANAAFYRVMLGAKGDPGFTNDFRQQTEKRFRDLITRYGVNDEAKALPTDFRLSYISHASIGAIVWWLENDQPCSVEQLARWIGQLSISSAGLLFQYK
jgi:AcrR family transcriptional regulator